MAETYPVTVRVLQSQHAKLRTLAKARGTSLSGVLGEAIERLLGEDGTQKKRAIKRRPHTVRVTYRGEEFRDGNYRPPADMAESAERTLSNLGIKKY